MGRYSLSSSMSVLEPWYLFCNEDASGHLGTGRKSALPSERPRNLSVSVNLFVRSMGLQSLQLSGSARVFGDQITAPRLQAEQPTDPMAVSFSGEAGCQRPAHRHRNAAGHTGHRVYRLKGPGRLGMPTSSRSFMDMEHREASPPSRLSSSLAPRVHKVSRLVSAPRPRQLQLLPKRALPLERLWRRNVLQTSLGSHQ